MPDPERCYGGVLNPEFGNSDNFGSTVAVDGDLLAGRTPLDDFGAVDAGSAYLFDLRSGALLRTFRIRAQRPPTGFWQLCGHFGKTSAHCAVNDDIGTAVRRRRRVSF